MLLIRLCAALIFFHAAAAICAGQSAGPAKADAASRASATYQQGLSALRQGDLAFARAAFERVLRLLPPNPGGDKFLRWGGLPPKEKEFPRSQFPGAPRLEARILFAPPDLGDP